MDTRIPFGIDDETKRLAQQLADQKRKALFHDARLTEQVNLAFEKFDSKKSLLSTTSQPSLAWRNAKLKSVTETNDDFGGIRVSTYRENSLSFFTTSTPKQPKKTDDIIEARVENLLEQPHMGVQRDGIRGRLLNTPKISMMVSYCESDTIHIMRVLHQKQKLPAA